MKRRAWMRGLAAAAAAVLLLTACSGGGAGGTAPSGETTASAETTVSAETSGASETTVSAETTAPAETAAAASVIEAPQIPAKDFPVTDGSTATLPLGWMLYRLCTGENQGEAEKAMEFTKTNNSYLRLMDQEADLVIAYEAGPGAKEDPRYSSLEIEPIGLDALVFICNTSNPVESLTTEQIQKIYSGKIRNWKEVGGENIDIVAFQRKVNSGSQTLMENLMMKGIPMADAPKEYRPSEMGELIDGVADFSNTGNALGYSVFFYAKNMYTKPNLRFMAVDGVMPSSDTIRSGEYKYVNPFYAAIRKDEPKDSNARRLFDWLTSEDGQSLVEAMDYVAIRKAEKTLPEGIIRELSLQNAAPAENKHRLAIDGMTFDGDAGVVFLDKDFKVAGREDGIRLRERDRFALIRGSVIPAELPAFTSGGEEEAPDYIPVGLYDVDKRSWVVKPGFDYVYTECMDGVHTIYYFGNWGTYYDEDGNYLGDDIPGVLYLYDENGTFIRKQEYVGDEEWQKILSRTLRRQEVKNTYDETTGISVYDLGGGVRLVDESNYETGDSRAVLEENGKVVEEGAGGTIYPFMLDNVMEDAVPYGWCTVDMYWSGKGEDGLYAYEDRDDFIVSPSGIRYRLQNRTDMGIVLVDEAFFILLEYNSTKYEIRDYEDNVIFSWIEPEQYEYW